MDISQILALVPDYQVFYTVDELNQESLALEQAYPETISSFVIGSSRQGYPIRCLKMGTGKKNALCFACPHPNEPIGAMTLITLAGIFGSHPEILAESGFTWYLIPCIDPDSTRLNESWFKGPFTLLNYVKGFYRPPGSKQVEWTFPVDIPGCHFNDPLPETQALMRLMDELKPTFMFSLHNSTYGGAYWYLTKEDPALCAALENAARRQDVPLHLGEPEALYIKKYSPAVFSMLSITALVNYMLKAAKGIPPTLPNSGGCSADYIATVCDCLTMLAELPYFYDPRICDESESEMTRGEALLAGLKAEQSNYAILGEYWQQIHHLFQPENPFFEFVDTCIAGVEASVRSKRAMAAGEEGKRMAKVSEVFDNLYGRRIPEALNYGLASRACKYELAHPEGKSINDLDLLSLVANIFDKEVEQTCAWVEKHAGTAVIPIKKLVSIQLESALLATQSLL